MKKIKEKTNKNKLTSAPQQTQNKAALMWDFLVEVGPVDLISLLVAQVGDISQSALLCKVGCAFLFFHLTETAAPTLLPADRLGLCMP